MWLRWWRQLRRNRWIRRPFSDEAQLHLEHWFPVWQVLTREEQTWLRQGVLIFLAEKNWEGCRGFEVTEEVKIAISAWMAYMCLGIRDVSLFDGVLSILIYPSTFIVPVRERLPGGIEPEGSHPLIGEAWVHGPVILAWDEILDLQERMDQPRNVIVHEFAHQVDFIDGVVDGVPPAPNESIRHRWESLFHKELKHLQRQTRFGVSTLLDEYGATNASEFFAVACETFFGSPEALKHERPELYQLLAEIYQQDPAARRMIDSAES